MEFLNSSYYINWDLLAVGIVIGTTVVIGFTVFFEGPQNATRKTFFGFSLLVALWGTFNYLSYQPFSITSAFLILRFTLFAATWMTFFFLLFALSFPEERLRLSKILFWFLVLWTIFISFLTLTPFVLEKVGSVSPTGAIASAINGPAMPAFGITTALYTLVGLALLLFKTIRTDKENRKRYLWITVGVLIMFFSVIISNLILPVLFNNPTYLPLAALFVFPFVAFTAYAILRHKLFNIRVAGTAVLVFLLSIVTFSEVILARDIAIIIYRSSIFILVLSFGTLLIKGVIREVKQREELERLSEKLEVANVRLDAAYKKVDKLSKAKSEFISIASHQLRTPLSAIKGYISMLVEGTYGKLSERAKRPLENVYQSNERLIKLVNDLLNISRIEAGRMELVPESVQIEEVVDSAVKELKITAEKKKLYLNWEKPRTPLPKFMLDKDKIRQVFLNLLNNAIKYTNQGGITIKLKTINHKLQTIIKDTGEGMTQDDLDKIFQTFSRGTVGTQLAAEGAGLGLYIAKKFVEMHQGRIWAESEGAGKGSTFFVELLVK